MKSYIKNKSGYYIVVGRLLNNHTLQMITDTEVQTITIPQTTLTGDVIAFGRIENQAMIPDFIDTIKVNMESRLINIDEKKVLIIPSDYFTYLKYYSSTEIIAETIINHEPYKLRIIGEYHLDYYGVFYIKKAEVSMNQQITYTIMQIQ